jgi:electron transport complex protein RnfA
VLGTSLLIINKNNSFVEAIFSSISVAIGFSLVLIIFNLLREKVSLADVPKPFKGAAIGLVTAGLMSLGFMGLIGLQ